MEKEREKKKEGWFVATGGGMAYNLDRITTESLDEKS
jgi:hypothetical protein